ncbi:hypothetical protein IZ6_03010 [Terrihabitans soli]|uniref:BrnA antitoxin family protein n=1 Tax=Terrihabitans soli TaxID=708113 RepID=A0A6S6QK01_9HYPH|nr:BrnA antitoxin family protein [Terrihabitans soli]BCJ89566.1 hypothetical protein IZ6_03010 [Terrihabitans soli]
MARKPAKKTARKAPKAKRPAAKKKATKRVSAKKGGLSSLFKPVKQSVTIRLDSDVVSWFKKQADKYQTEINSVLRKHMLKRG